MKERLWYLKLSLKNSKNVITGLILTGLFSILFLVTNYCLILYDYSNKINNYNIDNRTYVANINSKENFEKIKNINHINQVTIFNINAIAVSFENKYSFSINVINEKELKNIDLIDGKKEIGDGKIICPKKIYDEGNDSVIDSKPMIAKEYVDLVYKYDVLTGKPIDKREYKYTIAGNYDAKKYANELNTCYGSEEDVYKVQSYLFDEINVNNYNQEYAIVVDNYKNMDSVKKELEKIGIKKIDTIVYVDKIKVAIMIFLPIIILVIVIFVISVYLKHLIERELIKRKNDIKLMKAIGYSSDKVISIYKDNYMLVIFVVFIFTNIFSALVFKIASNYIERIDEYSVLSYKIHALTIIIIMLISFVYSNIIIKRSIKEVLNSKQIRL